MKSIIVFLSIDLVLSLRVQNYAKPPRDEVKFDKEAQKSIEQKAHIFFINLHGEKDRCSCVTSQLQDAPYPITRIAAATPDTMHNQCANIFAERSKSCHATSNKDKEFSGADEGDAVSPDVETHDDAVPVGKGGTGHKMCGDVPCISHQPTCTPGQLALYCSNYLTWQHFYHNSTAQYAIILEDDVVLKNGFWDHVRLLLDSSCDKDWDYLTVDGCKTWISDTYADIGHSATCSHASGQAQQISNMDRQCTHMQIIRRSAIPKMLQHANENGATALDYWRYSFPVNSMNVATWTPNICTQTSHCFEEGCVAEGDGCKNFDSTIRQDPYYYHEEVNLKKNKKKKKKNNKDLETQCPI